MLCNCRLGDCPNSMSMREYSTADANGLREAGDAQGRVEALGVYSMHE